MRKLFLFFCCILYSQLHSQKIYSFNVELNDKNNVPTFTILGNQYIYSGKNPIEKSFFENYIITNFYATYPNYSGYLQNVFTFVTTSSKLMDDLKKYFPTKYLRTEDLTGMNVQLLSYPNDYGTTSPVTNLGSSMSLKSFDYVNAPKAWDFFPNNTPKGNVIIGISDGMVNNTDLDFGGNKVSYLQQNLFNPNYSCANGFEARHGTSVAAIAAAQGNNGHGITGVCYDCNILNIPYTVDYNNTNFSGLMQLAQQGARVINMSWQQGYFTDPTYVQGFLQTQQDAINQLHDMGVVLVAGAGNETSAWLPNDKYVYPASYNHVISVTTVHSKNPNLIDELTGPVATYGYISNYNEDVICVNGGIGTDLNNPVFVPFIEWSTTTNSRVDICGPAYAPLYPNYILGCPGLYGDTTSVATPFVTGTVALMQSLNSCILPDEVEDVLQLTSKNLENKVINNVAVNAAFVGRSGTGKLETGDAVEFTSEMMSSTGNALIYGQNFWRFNFDLQHINNKLTISNQIFRDSNTSNFIAKNTIEVLQNSDFKPNSSGFVDLKIDGNLSVCVPPAFKNAVSSIQENQINVINKAKLYPNPNNGIFSILLDQIEVKNLEVTIFDVIGKSVYKTKVDQNEFELNVSHLPSGMYLVNLSSNSINETLKFVKK